MILAGPGVAAAQVPTSPLTPGLPQPAASTPTATTAAPVSNSTSTSTDSGLSGTGAIGIAIGAAIVLGGIALFIWRDARRRAPVKAAALPAGGTRAGTKAKPKPRKPSPAERRRRKRGRAR
jgi:hypothetical protein